jgi:UDP-N-acetylglucosamine:LPS N-acetylglucosamine transferase
MKVLIFSVSAGGGHVHAAEAIKKYLLLNNPTSDVMIVDTLKYINPLLDKVVIGSYLKTLKLTPSIFGKIYDFAESYDSLSNVSTKVNEAIIYRLIPLINEFKPNVVIASHPFSAEMISLLKLKGEITVPTVTILTDYAPHSFWLHDGIDAYIVSNKDMLEDMIRRGIDKNRIYDFGIPVNPEFTNNFNKAETLSNLGLASDKTTLLLMGGSLGMGKISHVYNELQQLSNDVQLIVITGKNKKLHEKLNDMNRFSKKETRIIGYSTEINKYMQASDLLITKPGGLTVTEALICNLPIAIFSAIPGQEEKNAEFLLKNNLSINLGDVKNCKSIVDNLLSSPATLKTMKENCKNFAKPNSGNDIVNLLEGLTSNKGK